MAHIITVAGATPRIHESVFLAPTAAITGDVEMAERSSAFYGVSARGDSAPIRVGAGTNLQDNVVLHADEGFPCTLGAGVSVGHSAVVHGATVEDDCLIGMSATVMNGAVIGAGSLVAARVLELEDHLERKPGNLSGGQRQRVAMGRAIVREADAFLFDEPLSNLDAKLRGQMRASAPPRGAPPPAAP